MHIVVAVVPVVTVVTGKHDDRSLELSEVLAHTDFDEDVSVQK